MIVSSLARHTDWLCMGSRLASLTVKCSVTLTGVQAFCIVAWKSNIAKHDTVVHVHHILELGLAFRQQGLPCWGHMLALLDVRLYWCMYWSHVLELCGRSQQMVHHCSLLHQKTQCQWCTTVPNGIQDVGVYWCKLLEVFGSSKWTISIVCCNCEQRCQWRTTVLTVHDSASGAQWCAGRERALVLEGCGASKGPGSEY